MSRFVTEEAERTRVFFSFFSFAFVVTFKIKKTIFFKKENV